MQQKTEETGARLGASSAGILGRGDLMKGHPEVDWLIPNVVRTKSLVMLYADSGVGKSTTTLGMALHVATGTPWNRKSVKQGRVYYIASENPELFYAPVQAWEKQHKGFKRWEKKHPESPDAPFFLLTEPVILTSPDSVADLLAKIDDAALIVIDTLFASMGDGDTKDGKDAYKAIRAGVDRIKDAANATVLLVHHTTPGGTEPYGGTSWHGGIQTRIFLTRQRNEKNFGEVGDFRDGDTIKLICKKMTGAPQFKDITLPVKLVQLGRGLTVPVIVSEKGKRQPRTSQPANAPQTSRNVPQKLDFDTAYAGVGDDRNRLRELTGMSAAAIRKRLSRMNQSIRPESDAA